MNEKIRNPEFQREMKNTSDDIADKAIKSIVEANGLPKSTKY